MGLRIPGFSPLSHPFLAQGTQQTGAAPSLTLHTPVPWKSVGGGEKHEEEQTGTCPPATAAAGLRPAAHFPCSPQAPRRRSLNDPFLPISFPAAAPGWAGEEEAAATSGSELCWQTRHSPARPESG